MRIFARPLAFALLLALGACRSTPESAPPDKAPAASVRSLPKPERLPATARPLWAHKRQRPGAALRDRLWAGLFHAHQSTREIALEIASEPRLARPVERDATELNALLPDAFFDLQDELLQRATDVAQLAAREDSAALANAIGGLTSTCVRCHAAYLGEGSVEASAPDDPRD